MSDVDVDDIADRLYALPPERFTAARDEASRQAPAALRQSVRRLRKPTVSAWVVNRLVRERPEAVAALLDVGDRLRTAMTDGTDVRALTEQRRRAVATLLGAARELAERPLTAGVEADVAATLEAATADPGLGEAVSSGRLVKPLRYAGFGVLPDVADVAEAPAHRSAPARRSGPARQSPPARTRDGVAAAAPRREVTRLRTRALELAGVADDAQRRYDEAVRAVERARVTLQAAERERAHAHQAARAAHKAAEQARRELGRMERE